MSTDPTATDLRDRVAGVIAAAGGRYDGADPDTIADAVMGVVSAELSRLRERAESAEARLAAVRELHAPRRYASTPGVDLCEHCTNHRRDVVPHPCPTLRTIGDT